MRRAVSLRHLRHLRLFLVFTHIARTRLQEVVSQSSRNVANHKDFLTGASAGKTPRGKRSAAARAAA